MFLQTRQPDPNQRRKPDYNEQNRAEGIRRYDVGVDANGYAPVSIEEILKFFEDVETKMMD